jgi:hypothetical protein
LAFSNNCGRKVSAYGAVRRSFIFRVDKLLREIANPNLHDIPTQLPFRVEMWDRHDQHIRWVIAASSSVAVGHAALDAAIAAYPGERFTLRNGIHVIRQHGPSMDTTKVPSSNF